MRGRSAPAIVALVILIAGTLVATTLVHERELQQAANAADDRAQRAVASIEGGLDAAATRLDGLSGFLASGAADERDSFPRYSRRLMTDGGLSAVAVVERVEAAHRARFERERGLVISRSGGGPLAPSDPAAEFLPIADAVNTEGPPRSLGVDLARDPDRRPILAAARDGGRTRVSAPVWLLGRSPRRGLLIVTPVYQGGVVPATRAQRRRLVEAYALGLYRIEALASVLRAQFGEGPLPELRVDGDWVLGEIAPGSPRRATLSFGGREWQVTAAAPGGLGALPVAILAGGGLASVLVAMLLVTLLRRERHTARVVRLRLAERDRAEQIRRAGEARLDAIVATAADGIVLADAQGRIIGWNGAATAMFGYSELEALDLELVDLMPARFRVAHRAGLARATKGGHSALAGRAAAMTGRRRDGAEFPLELTVGTWLDGEERFFSGILRDVSERHAAEERLRASEEAFRLLAETSTDVITTRGPDSAFTYVSPACTDLLGYAPEELIGRTPEELVHPDDLPEAVGAELEAAEGTGVATTTVRFRHRDGRLVWLETTTRVALDADGGIGELRSSSRDVTARVLAEARMRASEERYRALVTHAPAGIFETDHHGRVVFANDAWHELTGLAAGAAYGQPWTQAVHPDDLARVGTESAQALASDTVLTIDFRLLRPDGDLRHVCAGGVGVRDAAGRISGYLGTLTDQTQRARAEEELEHGRSFLAAVLDSVGEGVVACDADGELVLFNRATRLFHGLPADPLPPDRWTERYDLYRADGITPLPVAEIPLFRALQGEELTGVEMVVAPHNGTRRTMEAGGRPILGADGRRLGAVVSMHDVTARRAAERELRSERDRSAALIRSVRDGLAMVDSSGVLLEANDRYLELVGRPAAEVLGRRPPYPWWPAEDAARLAEGYRAALRGEPMETDARMVHPDGTELPVLIAAAAVRGDRGDAGIVVSVKDMTERNEVERMKDEFVALASHELRSPLTSVLGYLELALEGDAGQLSPTLERYLRVAERNGRSLQRLSDDLLTVARADAGRLNLDRRPLDLAHLALECVEDQRPRAQEQQVCLEWDGVRVEGLLGDGARLRQVVTNLVSNALKFTPPGGRVTVSTGTDEGMALVAVSDTGMGIPPEEQERLFERFYRTRSATVRQIPGTGLGLAISRLIVEGHGGTIQVESAEGAGTTFRVALPLAPVPGPVARVSASR